MNPTTYGTWPYPGENMFYPAGSTDPVRANAPYTPVEIVDPTGAPTLHITGILALVGAVVVFEWLRHKRFGKRF